MSEDFIIGRNSVREALRSGRTVDALYVQKGITDGSVREILTLARKNGIVIKEVPARKLDELAENCGYEGKINHQGVAAQVPPFAYSEIEDIFKLAEERGEPPFLIALDGIKDPHNLGAIIRSAEVLGAHGVIVLKRRSALLTASACKAACGAAEYLPIVKVTNLSSTLKELKEKGVWIAAADMDGQPAYKTNLKGAICLVIGSEGDGVSRLVKETCDFVIKIDVKGKVNSLNASAAAAVLMYEKLRQEAEK